MSIKGVDFVVQLCVSHDPDWPSGYKCLVESTWPRKRFTLISFMDSLHALGSVQARVNWHVITNSVTNYSTSTRKPEGVGGEGGGGWEEGNTWGEGVGWEGRKKDSGITCAASEVNTGTVRCLVRMQSRLQIDPTAKIALVVYNGRLFHGCLSCEMRGSLLCGRSENVTVILFLTFFSDQITGTTERLPLPDCH